MTNVLMQGLETSVQSVVSHRGRPLLVLYYPDADGHISDGDADDVYQRLREADVTKEKKLDRLDVLLHTLGGDPIGAYRVAQVLRLLASQVEFLVAKQAFSAGSLLALSGDWIWMADNAGLSPFDIQLTESTVPESEISLASIDNFVEFAKDARQQMEQMLQENGLKGSTDIDSDLLCAMVHQVGALKIAEYYRERLLTANYAEVLLDSYMFREQSNAAEKRRDVIDKMVHWSPSHEYFMDFELAQNASLRVRRMNTELSDLTRAVIDTLDKLTEEEVICFALSDDRRMPMIRLYGTSTSQQGDYDGHAEGYEGETERTVNRHIGGTLGDVQEEARTTQEARGVDFEESNR